MSAEVEFFHDRLTRIIVEGSPVRVLEVDLRDTAQEAVGRHKALETAGLAMAQALVAVTLLGGHIKGEERLSLQAGVSGPLDHVMADYTAGGALRATVGDPAVVATGSTVSEKLRAGFGDGSLTVIKSTREREVYRGSAPLKGSDLEGALLNYLELSEQVDSVVWLHTTWSEDTIEKAQGLMIQALGGGDEGYFADFRARLDRGTVARALRSGEGVEQIVRGLFPDCRVDELDSQPLRFECTCSEERVASMLMAMGVPELEDMLAKDGGAEITCNMCRSKFALGARELTQLIEWVQGLSDGSTAN